MNCHSTGDSCRFRTLAEAEKYAGWVSPGISGEEWLARLYCEPKAYWHCTKQLDGSAYYTFAEISDPAHWLAVLGRYTQVPPSIASQRLHKRVEIARGIFRAKQDGAWGVKRLVGAHTPASYERQEAAAWEVFDNEKQRALAEYLRAVKSGRAMRRKRHHKCKQCGTPGVPLGFQYCTACANARKRDSKRRYKDRGGENGHEGDTA